MTSTINVKAVTENCFFLIIGSGKSKNPAKAAAKYGKDTLAEVSCSTYDGYKIIKCVAKIRIM